MESISLMTPERTPDVLGAMAIVPHLHVLVSAGGLLESKCRWIQWRRSPGRTRTSDVHHNAVVNKPVDFGRQVIR